MFSKRSRYYRLNDTAHPDRKGVERNCKALRKLPDVNGQFLHTLEASDRLDHLGYKYYRQSLHWWRICDANPGFHTPLALLDKTPSAELKLVLRWDGDPPPLSALYHRLEQLTGVERIDKSENSGQPDQEIIEGGLLFNLSGTLQAELNDAVHTQELPAALNTALQTAGLILAGELQISKPAETFWRITVDGGTQIFGFRYSNDTGQIAVRNETPLFDLSGTLQTELNNAVLTQELPVALDAALQTEGLVLSGQLRFSKPGGALWQVTVGKGEQLYRFYYSSDTNLIAVVESSFRWLLTISIVYNRNSLLQQEIDDQVTALGFFIEEAAIQTRIGQSILIPPRYTGKS